MSKNYYFTITIAQDFCLSSPAQPYPLYPLPLDKGKGKVFLFERANALSNSPIFLQGLAPAYHLGSLRGALAPLKNKFSPSP